MGFRDVEELRVYRRAAGVADSVWNNETLDILTRELNAYINFQKKRRIKEEAPDYVLDDPKHN